MWAKPKVQVAGIRRAEYDDEVEAAAPPGTDLF
jgi:hypothetical protein